MCDSFECAQNRVLQRGLHPTRRLKVDDQVMRKLVYHFSEGDKDQKDLLGGKGANLAEMTRLGLPVPPGFIITTEACRFYLEQGRQPDELRVQVTMALRRLEDEVGRRLGDATDPLLVSVRSGAKFSMPG